MTLENFNYRTNPLFLRNQFDSDNKYGIPKIPMANFDDTELSNLRLLAFNQLSSDNGKHSERMVHFFLYDYNFEKVWTKPSKYLEMFSKYKGVLTPDFSMYLEMPYSLQIYNTFRNRWCGAYYASHGIKVIPTVNWSDEGSFDFSFKGIEKGSIVAVSTCMFHEHGNHKNQKEIFMKGYNRMLEEVEPSRILCYSEPFDEMKGNIIYVDYDLSSWKYLNDKCCHEKYFKRTFPVLTNNRSSYIIYKTGYIIKGGGSAFGGDWQPKDANSERFIGIPNSTRINIVTTTKGSYKVEDKYNENGYATLERHLTDHFRSDKHSNPHDHKINWDKNRPDFSSPINYFDGNIPEFKYFKNGDEIMENKYVYNPDDYKFESLGEFKLYLSCGANVGFEFNGIDYGIEGHNNSFDIWIAYKGDIANGLTLDELMEYELDGVKIKDLILTATITERIL